MFTGIVEEVGKLRELRVDGRSARLDIEARRVLDGTEAGDSIAVAGVCLTVTELGHDRFWADAMPETVRRTTLAARRPGDELNLERALALQSRLGGHLVSGHVDGTGRVTRLQAEGTALVITITVPAAVASSCVDQGSIAVDGVSLTVVGRMETEVRVSLIPHTQGVTTLAGLRAGDEVNVEADLIAKYVAALLHGGKPHEGLTWEKLSEAGFL